MELRPHQIAAIEMLRQSLKTGHKRPLLAAPTGFGKTLSAAFMLKQVQDRGKTGIFLADRIKLVSQTCTAFSTAGIDFGVQQGNHLLARHSAPIQLCSIQTLARRKNKPDADIVIVDEAHIPYKSVIELMERWDNVPFIGLSATPYTKGLGTIYDDLLVPITTETLIDQGYLTPVHYFGGAKISTKGIKTKQLPTGGRDYDPTDLARASEGETPKIVGDIIRNWVTYGQNRQTIAFCVSILQSKYLVEIFNAQGIPAAHIDGYMPEEKRQELFAAHDAGEIKILSCSKLLGTGYDSPSTSCCIDLSPTKSVIAWQQRVGRIIRSHPGKEYAIYLDHAGNTRVHGFAECIVPSELHDGQKAYQEKDQVKKEKEKKIRECPECHQEMSGFRCRSCGYEIVLREEIESDDSMLEKLDKKKVEDKMEKDRWYSNLLFLAKERGYSPGWAAHNYRKRFGVWPRNISVKEITAVDHDIKNWITGQNIRFFKGREKSMLQYEKARV